ncbi:hypothetical protein CEXT_793101 [Caerostris extrusa]|uniref:Uncharacterized protein n=1 Tax=Caerostris extrusa TaxID=172846 RepID=A0AAV4V5J3_CAEEX|nr:hypothetical protein CEXT_793101 [Caerostris extrusa]
MILIRRCLNHEESPEVLHHFARTVRILSGEKKRRGRRGGRSGNNYYRRVGIGLRPRGSEAQMRISYLNLIVLRTPNPGWPRH